MKKLINDKFRSARGGYSRLLQLSCESCRTMLFHYQKDGPGPLKRLYIDRIQKPAKANKTLICSMCKKVLGTYYIYPKEKRPAYRLYQDAIVKKIIKKL